jgi:NDP-mannose synthase
MRAVILAGGKGTRLRPYTTLLPKPLVPIGGKYPILEIVIRQLAASGFDHITLSVNHLSHLIHSFFGDGSQWGIKIDYSKEDTPLSTIGPLTLIDDLPENFLVMNGDIITSLNYGDLLNEHIKGQNQISVASYNREYKIDFGVLDSNDKMELTNFEEKPQKTFNVSMGIYCIHRSVIQKLKKNEVYGFDNLMIDSLKNGTAVQLVPFAGCWYDIGQPEDYDMVNRNFDEIQKDLNLG